MAITEQEFEELVEFEYTGGDFNGYDLLGYIGNSDRNYITDAWVLAGANVLGWGVAELSAWMGSRFGRWALEGQPMDARHMQDEMTAAVPHMAEMLVDSAS